MHKSLKKVGRHMIEVAERLLEVEQAPGTGPYDQDRYAIGVVRIAHAGELVLKSCIAKEHPLLIFSKLPKRHHASGEFLNLEALFEQGRTHNYNQLPDILWAATGYELEKRGVYANFGRLRNAIQHFAIPDESADYYINASVEYVDNVLKPVGQHFWGRDFAEYF